jgi:D-tyrosyl-tRNA(Tyr) deacylase
MIGLLQRVRAARVEVAGQTVGSIGPGLAVLIGIVETDSEISADRLLDRLLGFRVFPNAAGRMDRSLADVQGGLLLVPQFTLAADTRKGMRASFTPAAEPAVGQRLFDYLVLRARARHTPVASGVFGADMQVVLANDGPVTFWLDAR